MNELITEEVLRLATIAASRKPPVENPAASECVRTSDASGALMYSNHNERLNIEFNVERLSFPGLQTMDPRIVRIPPGRNNELHRHAHESIFVILAGQGEVLIGDTRIAVKQGEVAFVPRWLFHQTSNTGDVDLVVLAITDFGFTSAVLGDYDRRTRLSENGEDTIPEGK
jgi:mannose-6-phosphate isomerase-like protein (cupin superfamily)